MLPSFIPLHSTALTTSVTFLFPSMALFPGVCATWRRAIIKIFDQVELKRHWNVREVLNKTNLQATVISTVMSPTVPTDSTWRTFPASVIGSTSYQIARSAIGYGLDTMNDRVRRVTGLWLLPSFEYGSLSVEPDPAEYNVCLPWGCPDRVVVACRWSCYGSSWIASRRDGREVAWNHFMSSVMRRQGGAGNGVRRNSLRIVARSSRKFWNWPRNMMLPCIIAGITID